MPAHFVDRDGYDGWIDDDLTLSYDGSRNIAGERDAYVDEMEARARSNGGELQGLVVRLYEEGAIRKVERIDGEFPGRGG